MDIIGAPTLEEGKAARQEAVTEVDSLVGWEVDWGEAQVEGCTIDAKHHSHYTMANCEQTNRKLHATMLTSPVGRFAEAQARPTWGEVVGAVKVAGCTHKSPTRQQQCRKRSSSRGLDCVQCAAGNAAVYHVVAATMIHPWDSLQACTNMPEEWQWRWASRRCWRKAAQTGVSKSVSFVGCSLHEATSTNASSMHD